MRARDCTAERRWDLVQAHRAGAHAVHRRLRQELLERLEATAELPSVLSAMGELCSLAPAVFTMHAQQVLSFVTKSVLGKTELKIKAKKASVRCAELRLLCYSVP